MTLTYALNESDFLQHQLFSASKSARIKKQRRKSLIVCSLAIICLSFLFYLSENKVLMYYFLISGILFFLFYPLSQKSSAQKHYQNFVAETFKNRFGQPITLTFTDNHIEASDFTGESKLYLTAVEDITETKAFFYLKIKSGEYLIIPKAEIENLDTFRTELQILAAKLKINFISDLDWKWQ